MHCLATPNGGGEGREARKEGYGVAAEEGSQSLILFLMLLNMSKLD
jgi:hypothetical protein